MRTLFLGTTVGVLLLAGCSADDPPREVQVAGRDWNGWDPDHRPTERRWTLDARTGETVEIQCSATFAVRVVSVAGDEVVIATSEEMAPSTDGGGMDLLDTRSRFVVTRGEVTEFGTPSLDGGCTFDVTLS